VSAVLNRQPSGTDAAAMDRRIVTRPELFQSCSPPMQRSCSPARGPRWRRDPTAWVYGWTVGRPDSGVRAMTAIDVHSAAVGSPAVPEAFRSDHGLPRQPSQAWVDPAPRAVPAHRWQVGWIGRGDHALLVLAELAAVSGDGQLTGSRREDLLAGSRCRTSRTTWSAGHARWRGGCTLST
jgi:hypothetical protein